MAAQARPASIDALLAVGQPASILCRLHSDRFTGVLFLESETGSAIVSVRDGTPVFAESPSTDSLADQLLDRGLLTPVQYAELSAQVSEMPEKSEEVAFCELAVRAGVLTPKQVDAELRRRVHGRLVELLGWEDCRGELDPSPTALSGIREYPQQVGPLVYMSVPQIKI